MDYSGWWYYCGESILSVTNHSCNEFSFPKFYNIMIYGKPTIIAAISSPYPLRPPPLRIAGPILMEEWVNVWTFIGRIFWSENNRNLSRKNHYIDSNWIFLMLIGCSSWCWIRQWYLFVCVINTFQIISEKPMFNLRFSKLEN